MRDQLLPKVTAAFFVALMKSTRASPFHTISLCNNNSTPCNNCNKMKCIFKQQSTLVMQRLNFEHQSVFRSATGVFLSTSQFLFFFNILKEMFFLPTGDNQKAF